MPVTASPIDLVILFIFAFVLLGFCAFVILRASKVKVFASTNEKSNIYARQLEELSKDLGENRIEKSEYDGAKNEILRRILRLKNENNTPLIDKPSPKLAIFSIGFIVLCSALIYFFIGQPMLKDLPSFKREKEILARPPESLSQNEIMLVLQSRAQKDTKDAIPHLLMGKVLLSEGRASDALHAFQAALRRAPNNAEALAEIGGTIFELNGGKIDNEFKGAINASLQIEPNNLTAQFYSGLSFWRNDKKEEAMEIWRAAFDKLPPKDISRIGLIARVIDEISKLDIGPQAGAMPKDMMGDDRMEFIKSMIERRRQKLSENPKDLSLRLSLARIISKSDKKAAQIILQDGLKYQSHDFDNEVLKTALIMQSQNGE